MESNSRRAFLTGRRRPLSPWEQFCRRMRRGVAGDFLDFGLFEGKGSARLTPSSGGDVRHARLLCREYGVVLALSGVNMADSVGDQSVLWVELDASLSGCTPLPEDSQRWFVQPGCLLSALVDAGLTQFSGQPGYLTIAAWLADRTLCAWPPGESWRVGLVNACVLTADGSSAVWGPFGSNNRLPLGTLNQQQLVPQLFSLVSQAPAREFMTHARWPARYRLDALAPQTGHDANLSHLFLGHGGDLGWLEWMVFEARPALPHYDWTDSYASRPISSDFEVVKEAAELDRRVKKLLDPHGVFPNPGQDL